MRVFISADMEGCTGVVSWQQCGSPSSDCYDWAFAREMMTHDVNAAIRGAIAGGASHVVVKDSHNQGRNLLISELEPGTELISGVGQGWDGMMQGINASFDCSFLVGYHAMAGTAYGTMEHTISGRIHRVWVNERETGEIGISIATSGQYGVPMTLIVSEEQGCEETAEWVPGVQQYSTKVGMGRYMAHLKHPSETGHGIEQAAKLAIANCKSVPAYQESEPTKVKIEFNRSEEADVTESLDGWTRLDGYTIEYLGEDWATAHRALRRAMSHSFTAPK